MRKLTPSHIVFNGKVGALTGANALTAKVGETVLLIHSQANRDTRPHLIGGHGDWVWETGKFGNPPQRTWKPGSSAALGGRGALYLQQPGVYAYLNHNLIEAFELGAAAHQGRGQVERRSDEADQGARPDPALSRARPATAFEDRCHDPSNKTRPVGRAGRPARGVGGRTPRHRPSTRR